MRQKTSVLAATAVVAVALLGAVPTPAADKATPSAGSVPTQKKLASVLTREIEQEGFQGPVREILSFLANRYSIHIEVDSLSFKMDLQLAEVEANEVRLNAMRGVKLGVLLERIADQVGGVILLRPGYLELTTAHRALDECRRQRTDPNERDLALVQGEVIDQRRVLAKLRLVHCYAEDMPFQDVIKQLEGFGASNIVVDVRAREQAGKPVTAKLANVPLETALKILADMVDLKVVALDNVKYITTPERAAAMERSRKESRRKERRTQPAGP